MIAATSVTHDSHRPIGGTELLKCSAFGDAIIEHMSAPAPGRVAVGAYRRGSGPRVLV